MNHFSETIISDYSRPDAIMVPHYQCELTPLLESIASTVSKSSGVILLSSDKCFSEAFIETQQNPQHFTLITASLDTPWIRDRSPVAIKTPSGIRWCDPGVEDMGRPNDEHLFSSISTKKLQISPIPLLPQGNLVAGNRGLMLSTSEIVKQNNMTLSELDSYKEFLGIRHWLIFSGFRNEITGHADVHVRVLSSHLIAVAWNLSVKVDRVTMQNLIKKIQQYDGSIEVIKIPIRSKGKKYASLVNWIQIGKKLFIPRFDLTPKDDIKTTTNLLNHHGFKVEYIYSPTLNLGGSLHCLTASIYIA